MKRYTTRRSDRYIHEEETANQTKKNGTKTKIKQKCQKYKIKTEMNTAFSGVISTLYTVKEKIE